MRKRQLQIQSSSIPHQIQPDPESMSQIETQRAMQRHPKKTFFLDTPKEPSTTKTKTEQKRPKTERKLLQTNASATIMLVRRFRICLLVVPCLLEIKPAEPRRPAIKGPPDTGHGHRGQREHRTKVTRVAFLPGQTACKFTLTWERQLNGCVLQV